jgi:hypothetical protein
MSEFESHEAFKAITRNSREVGVVALAEMVTLPEEKPDPPELSILVNAQRAIRDTHTIFTSADQGRGGQRINFQPSNEARQKVIDELAEKRDKATAA